MDDIKESLVCLMEFLHMMMLDKKHMRSYVISGSLESVQEIKDQSLLSASLNPFRPQTDALLHVRNRLLFMSQVFTEEKLWFLHLANLCTKVITQPKQNSKVFPNHELRVSDFLWFWHNSGQIILWQISLNQNPLKSKPF